MTRYEITFTENPTAAELQILGDGIYQFTAAVMGNGRNQPLTFFVRDEAGTIMGGVHGNYDQFGWLYISTLWVSEKVRGHGYATQLMACMEAAAIKGGCGHAYLDTFSFQAPGFYKKVGYTLFAELEDYPVGHSRCFFRKKLVHADS
jgi:GNAT superfamily N-acetyltransferase